MSRNTLKFLTSKLLLNKLQYAPSRTNRKTLHLTFDDGPTADTTSAILDTLDHFQIKASFFLTGSNIDKHPEIVSRQLASGHIVGNHGYLHCPPGEIGNKAYLDGLDQTQKMLDQLAGRKLRRLFRPPFGTLSFTTLPGILLRGYRVIMWNFDSQDSYITDNHQLLSAASKFTQTGSTIMLLHDDGQITVDILPGLIAHALESGYAIKRLPL